MPKFTIPPRITDTVKNIEYSKMLPVKKTISSQTTLPEKLNKDVFQSSKIKPCYEKLRISPVDIQEELLTMSMEISERNLHITNLIESIYDNLSSGSCTTKEAEELINALMKNYL
ncbi:MAG: hypothetical protein R3Y28_07430 [Candidatus Gastranaerophilales bacterium]